MEGEELYSVKEAERILQRADRPLSESRIRQLLRAGELEGVRDERGSWHVYRREVHRLLEGRRGGPSKEAPSEAREALESDQEEWSADRVAALERELGRLKCRLELTERAESTLREQLDRERQRTELERQRAELERQRAERLEAELEEARRPWWRRLLGG
jgi:hypothetical protein